VQFKFLRERVIEKGVLGWIIGSPGTGKSTTALEFASTLDRNEWVVTWIHLTIEESHVCSF
jgi:KaiC/GvpD/RAD55 family RecA-like ATPase